MQSLLIVLIALLNVGGVVSIVWSIGQGSGRWIGDLVVVAVLDVIGFSLLRVMREDG
jgi:hypothetical protein